MKTHTQVTTGTQILRDLAPTTLRVLRQDRFDGSGFSVPLAGFSGREQRALEHIYASVRDVYDAWLHRAGAGDIPSMGRHIADLDSAGLMAAAQSLGAGSADPAIRRIVHDIRGGGLSLLIGTSELLREGVCNPDLIRACVGSARDHAKMMRAVLPELDPPRHIADEKNRLHGTDGVVAAFDGLRVVQSGRQVSVAVSCDYHGPVSARCLEIASLDRVLYNLVNNAVRFSAGDAVQVSILCVGGSLTRWVVRNELAAKDEAWVLRETGGHPGRLFAGGVTNGGTGIGLSNCAQIVSACFGLESPEDAVEGGYIGARIISGDFYAWFHWPKCSTGF